MTGPPVSPGTRSVLLCQLDGRHSGDATIGDSRMPAATVWAMLEGGATPRDVHRSYPHVTVEDAEVLQRLQRDLAERLAEKRGSDRWSPLYEAQASLGRILAVVHRDGDVARHATAASGLIGAHWCGSPEREVLSGAAAAKLPIGTVIAYKRDLEGGNALARTNRGTRGWLPENFTAGLVDHAQYVVLHRPDSAPERPAPTSASAPVPGEPTAVELADQLSAMVEGITQQVRNDQLSIALANLAHLRRQVDAVRTTPAVKVPSEVAATTHRYLSTGCLHGEHGYCQAMTGQQGEKRPGKCKFCDARCVCDCHRATQRALTVGDQAETADDLARLPVGAVVRTHLSIVAERVTEVDWLIPGVAHGSTSSDLSLPARVLYLP